VDVLLTACTSSIVFWLDELLTTGRLESTRLLLHTDTTLRLLCGSWMLTDGDDDVVPAAVTETIHTSTTSVG